jgi:hypothetical protein
MRNAGLIRGLIYPIQFEKDPRKGIERVLDLTVEAAAMDGTPSQYLAAIEEALATDDKLAELIPQDHSEDAIRGFLRDTAEAIRLRWRL